MKFNFKKVASVMASLAMVGSTMGFAVAANYPAPFTSGSVNDVAIVVGSGTGANDMAAALSIGQNLASAWGGTVGVGDESVKLERSADKFNLGNSAKSVFLVPVTKDHLPNLLADGTFRGEDRKDYKFTQKIDLGSDLNLTHFRDYDYKQDEPTLGIKLASNTEVLTYTLQFTNAPDMNESVLKYADLPIMGKKYFVSEVGSDSLTLLDSSTSQILEENGAVTMTVGGKTYSISAIGFTADDVRLSVDGKTTGALRQGDVYNIEGNVYLGVKDYIPVQVERDTRVVEIVIGSGKMELTDNSKLVLNDETVNEIDVQVNTAADKLTSIALTWKTDDTEFITSERSATMPVFEDISLVMTGMKFPESETVRVEADGSKSLRISAPLKDGDLNLNLLYTGTTVGSGFIGLGRDDNNVLATSRTNAITFDETGRDRWFVASWTNEPEFQTFVLQATSSVKDNQNKTTIRNVLTNTNVCTDVVAGGTCTIGNIILNVTAVDGTTGSKSVSLASIGSAGTVSFNTLYTENGLRVTLPWVNSSSSATEVSACPTTLATANGQLNIHVANVSNVSTTCYPTSYTLQFKEADKDGKWTTGNSFNLTLNVAGGTNDKTQVGGVSGLTLQRIKDSDDEEGYMYTELASKVLYLTSGDQNRVEITHFGGEVYGEVYLTSGAESTGANIVPITDTEAANLNVNMIVVGGSCINSVAASLLGVSPQTCGAAWTSATNVGAGQYLIQSFNRSGKIATLVAGYEAADTTNAANALRTQTIETTAGVKYTGSTASNPVKQ